MKPLDRLNNVEKAKLLHQLLPGEIPAAIKTVSDICTLIVEGEKELSETWDNPMMSLSMWVALAKDSQRVIKNYGKKLETSPAIFSDQLFDGYNSLLVNHCLQQHATKESTSKVYKQAIAFLYNFE